MKRRLSILLLWLLLAGAVRAADGEQEELARIVSLDSVVRREGDVLASDALGLFRAEVAERVWRRLPMPEGMLPGGSLAWRAAEPELIY